jgi:hypothetical protein
MIPQDEQYDMRTTFPAWDVPGLEQMARFARSRNRDRAEYGRRAKERNRDPKETGHCMIFQNRVVSVRHASRTDTLHLKKK